MLFIWSFYISGKTKKFWLYKFERVSQGNSCEYREYKIILDTSLRWFLRWCWKMKWFCCRMPIFLSKYEPCFWEKSVAFWVVSFCSAAERHGYGPQHDGGGLRGYARDKHGGPCFLIMGTEIVRPGWCEVEGAHRSRTHRVCGLLLSKPRQGQLTSDATLSSLLLH